MTKVYELNEYKLQLLSDINRLYHHLQLSTYEVQMEAKGLEKIICSAQKCIDELEKITCSAQGCIDEKEKNTQKP